MQYLLRRSILLLLRRCSLFCLRRFPHVILSKYYNINDRIPSLSPDELPLGGARIPLSIRLFPCAYERLCAMCLVALALVDGRPACLPSRSAVAAPRRGPRIQRPARYLIRHADHYEPAHSRYRRSRLFRKKGPIVLPA